MSIVGSLEPTGFVFVLAPDLQKTDDMLNCDQTLSRLASQHARNKQKEIPAVTMETGSYLRPYISVGFFKCKSCTVCALFLRRPTKRLTKSS